MDNFDSTYSILNDINESTGLTYDSAYSICLAIYKKLGGTKTNFDSVYSLALEIKEILPTGGGGTGETEELEYIYTYITGEEPPAGATAAQLRSYICQAIDELNATITSQAATITSQSAQIETKDATIATQAATITSQTAEIQEQEATIDSQAATITAQTEEIATKQATITAQTAEIASQAATISQQADTITAQTAEIATKDATITSQTAEINTQAATITAQTAQINQQSATISQQEATITAQTAEIETKTATITAQTAEIATKDATIANQEATITAQTEEIATKDATITSQTAQINSQAETITAQTAQINSQAETITAQTAQINTQAATITSQTAEIENFTSGTADSYTAAAAKGATMPAQQTIDNLPNTIASIPSGGGSGFDTRQMYLLSGLKPVTGSTLTVHDNFTNVKEITEVVYRSSTTATASTDFIDNLVISGNTFSNCTSLHNAFGSARNVTISNCSFPSLTGTASAVFCTKTNSSYNYYKSYNYSITLNNTDFGTGTTLEILPNKSTSNIPDTDLSGLTIDSYTANHVKCIQLRGSTRLRSLTMPVAPISLYYAFYDNNWHGTLSPSIFTTINNMDVSNTENLSYFMAMSTDTTYGHNGYSLDLSGWDTSHVTNFNACFSANKNLTSLNLVGWSAASLDTDISANYNAPFYRLGTGSYPSTGLTSFVGNHTESEAEAGTIKVFDDLHVNFILDGYSSTSFKDRVNRASLLALINGLRDMTGDTGKTLTIGSAALAKLTSDDIAKATAKNWTIA